MYIENCFFDIDQQNLKLMEGKRSLKTLDIILCRKFFHQMFTKYKYRGNIEILNYIHHKMEMNIECNSSIECADHTLKTIKAYDNKNWWIAVQCFDNILSFGYEYFEVYSKTAKCLSYLHHHKDAEVSYFDALEMEPHDYKTNLSLAWHYLESEQSVNALEQFLHTAKIKRRGIVDNSLLAGTARAYELNGIFDMAEFYYGLATRSEHETTHSIFVSYLRTQRI